MGGLKQQKLPLPSGGQKAKVKVLAWHWLLWRFQGRPCLALPLPGSGGCSVPYGCILAASVPSSRACPLGISLLPLIRALSLDLGLTQICQGDLVLIS